MTDPRRDTRPDAAVLAAFGLAAEPLRPAAAGLINRTWHAVSLAGERLILQCVNPIFPPAVNEDIDAVTRHLAARGLPTTRIVPAADGRLWVEHGGAVWRVLTAMPGETRDALRGTRDAAEAGRVLAEFHAAAADFDRAFGNARLGVHDTAAHVARLRRALAEHSGHRDFAAVARIADEVLERAARLPELPPAPDRVVHGDPKVSNIMFDPDTDEALCLIDLDTLARMPVALELGDAMRSWCNPQLEDTPTASLSLPMFAAAVAGYARAAPGLLTEAEWSAIPDATLTITVELAARFCSDALLERYFRWDAERYPSAGAHNRARARGQLAQAASIDAQLGVMRDAVAAAFRG
ncbi:MAG: aminoglycoside phosphotransferase family protein [Gammaproteobacteria bacterium]|nr:aminoglycoside phosphotransferase family protein [Gammaproteobacteria bacterium]